ncbi:MAG: hypothetical protein V3U59_10075 [Gammaproteobacteria bacterium]
MPRLERIRVPVFGAIATLVVLGGCSTVKGWVGNDADQPIVVPASAGTVTEYLELVREFKQAGPDTKNRMYRNASSEYVAHPTAVNELRLALLTGIPGHQNTNTEEARDMLHSLMLQPASLLPVERDLARIVYDEFSERLDLEQQLRVLQAELRQARTLDNRQMQTVLSENRRLRDELADAEAKLEALTSIERTIGRADNGRELP